MQPRSFLAAAPLAALLAAPAAAQSSVWTVDETGGGDFTSLQDALAAAAPGDVLLVQDGVYGGSPLPFPDGSPLVFDEPMTVVAEGDAELVLTRVEGIAAGQAFVLRGFRPSALDLAVADSGGVVWLEDHVFVNDVTSLSSRNRVVVSASSSVVLNRVDLWGGLGFSAPAALVANGSGVHLYDSLVRGGTSIVHLTGYGAPGLLSDDSFAFASGTEFVHGPHNPPDGTPAPPDALQVGAGSTSVVLDTAGVFDVQGGFQQSLGGAARSFGATALAREGESVAFTWSGVPGDLAILNVSLEPGALFFDAFTGSGLLGAPLAWLKPVGLIPASGERTFSVPVPELGPGIEGVVLFSQGSFAELAVPQIRLGGGSATVLLDGSF